MPSCLIAIFLSILPDVVAFASLDGRFGFWLELIVVCNWGMCGIYVVEEATSKTIMRWIPVNAAMMVYFLK